MKTVHLLLSVLLPVSTLAQPGIFKTSTDIGPTTAAGKADYNPTDQTYNLKSPGPAANQPDAGTYTYTELTGDFILTATIAIEGNTKAGWMIRESAEQRGAYISGTLHGKGTVKLEWREHQTTETDQGTNDLDFKQADIIQLERKGNDITLRASRAGQPLQEIEKHTATSFENTVLAGLFIGAQNTAASASVWNVRIDRPVADDYKPETSGYLASRLEILDVTTGKRTVIHQSKGRFEAPNWMPDGKALLFNEGGSLYTIPIKGGTPKKVNTGFADRNNNDHGISFDGKMLAISHHRDGMPGYGSTVYVLPLQGGTPKLVTEQTPSYFHGWSADGKSVLYVAQRGNSTFNIYRAPIAGGPEVKLTQTRPGAHVDGPEASRDGKYIYYNASNTGTMQIYRMKPDGTDIEQLTADNHNNWFPHLSPDGKWICYLAFPPDINPNDHPAYKRVTLNLIPIDGGPSKIIAYLYGGQGTINVASWSPDSKYVAFVSNSK